MAPDNNEVRIDTMFRQSEKIRRKAATGVRWHQGVVLLTMLLLVQVVAACSLYTTSPIQPVASGGQSDQFDKQFDPNSYADKNWSSKVVPTIVDKSVDIGTVLKALEQNSDAAQKQYAVQSSDGLYNFMVKGTGKVIATNTSSRNGTLNIQLPVSAGLKKQPTILVQVGPVLLGTAIRDSVGFINYNQFTNQVQYAQVADALNARAASDLKSLDAAKLQGKTITFYGAFTYATLEQVMIAPVRVVPEGAGA
jgi:predicted lipoprotein